ncbi:MAG: site-specific DNA-methyltransferase [Chloroflexi bacterium]|nr:site-specific DNA-methyltransferase [Chloroflexota bacterium]MCY3938702.1 site-specific DNA-methyltransferase [Chloroflexota bacterium]
MASRRRKRQPLKVESLTHGEAGRTNIPTAEHQPLMKDEERHPIEAAFERRNPDLDPQLVWRGKDTSDWTDLVTTAPPLYIQEKVSPKALIDDLQKVGQRQEAQLDFFADFNGLPEGADRTDFYQHQANWSNRMILGDSLNVMASLAEREGLRGKVQCIYVDPPYGIKFNSNFQWSTTSRDVRDGNRAHITREPEQVKAFRDTWRDGIHSYLTYLRDRLAVARDLLSDSGSIFVQIGDENVHRVRALMDEVFGEENFHAQISIRKASPLGGAGLVGVNDYLLWYNKDRTAGKFRRTFRSLDAQGDRYYNIVETQGQRRSITSSEFANLKLLPNNARLISSSALVSSGLTPSCVFDVDFQGASYKPSSGRSWRTNPDGMKRLIAARRLLSTGNTLRYAAFFDDFPYATFDNSWGDTGGGALVGKKIYIVQTPNKVIERCILMTTDPGDLVIDPTCGSGTTADVAEQWGRRWITIDTSRVALALAGARIMGARYPWYLLADSPEGRRREAEIERREPSQSPTYGDIRQGFVNKRVPHITLRAIANNAEIDVIWERFEERLAPLREKLSVASGQWSGEGPTPVRPSTGSGRTENGGTQDSDSQHSTGNSPLQEWEVPRERPDDWPPDSEPLLSEFWETRIARQNAIDASIAAKADFEYLYDKPYEERRTVRVAGPFTVESLSPHRMLGVDEHGELIDKAAEVTGRYGEPQDFTSMILDNLRTAGVQQAYKEDRIEFDSLIPWPGDNVCAEGRYLEGGEMGPQRRAGVFVGPEFGTVRRQDLVEAAREAADAGFDLLIACAFNYEAHATEFDKLGRVPILKARMNPDLHMADELKSTGQGNLFVIFGEPDIDVLDAGDGRIKVQVKGVDVFDPSAGAVRSDDTDGIACWFIDTDYDSESFFVRHAYFLGANDPYKSLKRTLKAEIDADAWGTLHSDTSRPFNKPESGRIAVKVINHLGDEVMKVFRV